MSAPHPRILNRRGLGPPRLPARWYLRTRLATARRELTAARAFGRASGVNRGLRASVVPPLLRWARGLHEFGSYNAGARPRPTLKLQGHPGFKARPDPSCDRKIAPGRGNSLDTGGNALATQTAADLAGIVQGYANTIPKRAEDEDSREGAPGEASDEARSEQDCLPSGFTSPQGQRKGGKRRARREPEARGAVWSRPVRQMGCIDPQRWSSGSTDESNVPKRKQKEQRERVKQYLTSRFAASLRSNSRDWQREGEAMAAEGVDLHD